MHFWYFSLIVLLCFTADQVYDKQRKEIEGKLSKISDYFANKKYKVDTTEFSFRQMIDQIDHEKRINEKQILIDKYTRAKFKLHMGEEEEDEYDPINIHFDTSLTNEQKEMKKVKKILNNK
jgi:hypothetical protein